MRYNKPKKSNISKACKFYVHWNHLHTVFMYPLTSSCPCQVLIYQGSSYLNKLYRYHAYLHHYFWVLTSKCSVREFFVLMLYHRYNMYQIIYSTSQKMRQHRATWLMCCPAAYEEYGEWIVVYSANTSEWYIFSIQYCSKFMPNAESMCKLEL